MICALALIFGPVQSRFSWQPQCRYQEVHVSVRQCGRNTTRHNSIGIKPVLLRYNRCLSELFFRSTLKLEGSDVFKSMQLQ
jgi:hypothetical protein